MVISCEAILLCRELVKLELNCQEDEDDGRVVGGEKQGMRYDEEMSRGR